MQRSGTKVRIRVSLTRVADNASEDLGAFTEEFGDIFALQEKVARAVVEKLTHRQVASSVEVLTTNSEAYDLYLRGRSLQTRAGSYSREAAKLYEQAVALDPKFALAWARLAEARFRNYNSGSDHSPAVVTGAREAIDRALALRPDLPEALIARANLVQRVECDFSLARRDLDRAESLHTSPAELRWAQAVLARDVGNWPDAVRLARGSLELDPQNGDNANVCGYSFYFYRGDFGEADRLLARAAAIQGLTAETPLGSRVLARLAWRGPEAARRLVDRQPAAQSGIAWLRAWVLVQLGRNEEARGEVEAAATTGPASAQPSTFWFVRMLSVAEAVGMNDLARGWAEGIRANVDKEFERGNRAPDIHELKVHAEISLGHRDAALAALADWRGEVQRVPSTYRRMTEFQRRAALAYGRLGKADEAVALLRELEANGFTLSGYSLRYDLAYAPIRDDPRFQQLIQQAEAWAKAQPDPVDP